MCTNNLTHRLDTESPYNNETAQLEAYAIGACVMVQGCQCGTGLKPLVGITSLAQVEPTLSAELITLSQTCFRRGGTRGPSTGIAGPLVFSRWHGCEATGIFHFYWFAGPAASARGFGTVLYQLGRHRSWARGYCGAQWQQV